MPRGRPKGSTNAATANPAKVIEKEEAAKDAAESSKKFSAMGAVREAMSTLGNDAEVEAIQTFINDKHSQAVESKKVSQYRSQIRSAGKSGVHSVKGSKSGKVGSVGYVITQVSTLAKEMGGLDALGQVVESLKALK